MREEKKSLFIKAAYERMSYQIEMFKSGKCQYYLTIYDQFYLSYSGVCNVH